jgi:hypothetical protein
MIAMEPSEIVQFSVPFSQLANMEVYARLFGIRCILWGSVQGGVELMAVSDTAEWLNDIAESLEGSGIEFVKGVEQRTFDQVMQSSPSPCTEWNIGIT